MQIKNYSFQQLPFSELFKTYINNFQQAKEFYEFNPFDRESLSDKSCKVTCTFDRSQIVELLIQFNQRFEVDESAIANIRRFAEDNALAVVTGQQLGIYGGPVMTVYKTLATIQLAKSLEQQLNKPVIPVFWLADEDHDYEEVNSVSVPGGDHVETLSLSNSEDHRSTVAERKLSSELSSFKEQIQSLLPSTDFSEDLWQLLDESFKPEVRFDKAFGDLWARLFSKHGLVLAGSNNIAVKELTRECMKTAITRADEIREALDSRSELIKKRFHQQVTLYDSNLFYINKESNRVKISRNGYNWKTESDEEWSTDELVEEIDKHPGHFSPNVFLRPVLQDILLPTLGYVGGPGELAYYGQMKEMYHCFDMEMPVIFPRLSATLVEPAVDRILDELPFKIHEYDQRIEDLESAFVNRSKEVDIETIFSEWKGSVEKISDTHAKMIQKVDPTLEGAAGKTKAVYFGELDKLKGKVYRSVKQQEQTQLNRIRKIKGQLFPAGGMQERMISAIYFMNKYGVDVWDQLLKELDKDPSLTHHKLIYL